MRDYSERYGRILVGLMLKGSKLVLHVCMSFTRCVSRVHTCWNNPVPPSWTVILALITVQTGFGLYPVVVKKFNTGLSHSRESNPLIFSFYRDTLVFPVLVICAIVAERQLKVPSLKELPVFIMLGVLGMFCNQLLYILGVYHVGPNIASVFQQLIPIWGTILAVLTCTEKIPPVNKLSTWCKLLGILVAAGGAIEMITTGGAINKDAKKDQSSWYTLLGYVFHLGNTFCMALYVLLQKKFVFMKNSPWAKLPVSVTMWCYLFGSISMGLASIYYCKQPEEFKLPVEAAYALVFAILVTSALCYLLITWANQHFPATIVTAFWPFQVPVTVVSAYFITGDHLKPLQYLGAVMIIVGLILVVWSNHQENKHKKIERKSSDLEEANDDIGDEKSQLLHSPPRVRSPAHIIQDRSTVK
ncbi:uncharacterized protein [Dysidea avara]|uniref:uncharacterized protein isoform X1 n=1 Tax=Dysidea avara TaxID=196820 RepID=UPI0033239C25